MHDDDLIAMLGISQGSECEFSKFLISSRSIPVDKSCHSGLTCRSTRHEIITRYRGVILSRITNRKIDSNACEKKRRGRVCFHLQRQGGRSRKTRLALIGLKN